MSRKSASTQLTLLADEKAMTFVTTNHRIIDTEVNICEYGFGMANIDQSDFLEQENLSHLPGSCSAFTEMEPVLKKKTKHTYSLIYSVTRNDNCFKN
jgi:hypothetical protein